MTIEEYIIGTRTTWINYPGEERNESHALYGIVSEIGEYITALKRVVGYGRKLDVVNVNQECGDCYYYLARLVDQYQLDHYCLEPIRISSEILTDRLLAFAMMKEDVRMNDLLLNNDHSSYLVGSIHSIVNYLNVILTRIELTMEQCRITNHLHLKRAWENKNRGITRDETEEKKYLTELTMSFIQLNQGI